MWCGGVWCPLSAALLAADAAPAPEPLLLPSLAELDAADSRLRSGFDALLTNMRASKQRVAAAARATTAAALAAPSVPTAVLVAATEEAARRPAAASAARAAAAQRTATAIRQVV